MSSTSGQLPELELTWDSRNDETEPKTSPEELLAAAHAAVLRDAARARPDRRRLGPRGDHRHAKVSFELGIGITDITLVAQVESRRAPRRDAPRDRRARQGDVPASRRRSPASRSRSSCPTSRPRRTRRKRRPRSPATSSQRSTREADLRRGGRRDRRSPQPLRLTGHVPPSRRPSRSSSAPTSRRRSGSPIPPSTTTTARRRRSAGASRSSRRRTSSRRRGGRRGRSRRGPLATPSSPRWSPTTRPRSRGSRRS